MLTLFETAAAVVVSLARASLALSRADLDQICFRLSPGFAKNDDIIIPVSSRSTMVSFATRLCLILCILSDYSVSSFSPVVSSQRRFSERLTVQTTKNSQLTSSTAVATTTTSTVTLRAKAAQNEQDAKDRRRFLLSIPLALMIPQVAQARGLVQFPVTRPLQNIYHLMHVGTSLMQEEGIWSTNPLFLTNREDALSPTGQDEVVEACAKIEESGMSPTIVKYSLAASCIDTSNLIGRELKMGRDKLVPEFTFMDPRAIGQWDMLSMEQVEPAVWAMDVDEAGEMGLGGRPPPNEDGTPHETLADQSIRLRQLLSIMETQFSGDTILLVFPDGTSPALLSAMIAGVPYNRVHELEFATAEVRFDVTRESTLALWKSKQDNAAYTRTLEQGRKRLATMRSTEEFVNMKDQKIEAERLAIDQQLLVKAEMREKEEDINRKKQVERQRQVADSLQKKSRQRQVVDSFQKKSVGSSQVPSSVMSLMGLAAAGLATIAVGGGSSKEDVKKEAEADSSASARVTAAVALETPGTLATGDIFASAVAPTTTTSTSAPVISGNAKSLFDDGPTTIEGRADAAKIAMQQYMDQDDGGGDWLVTMSELMDEDEPPSTTF